MVHKRDKNVREKKEGGETLYCSGIKVVIFSHSFCSLLLLFSDLCLLLELPLPHPPSHYSTNTMNLRRMQPETSDSLA